MGRSLEIIYPQDWEIRVGEYIDEVVAQGQKSFEVVRVARDGTEMNISVSAAPIRDWTGEIIGISNIHRDITEKKQAEVHQQFILRELTHRTKNMIAVVSAIERQTANRSNSLEDFRASFGARLRGLAESNELLVASQWAAVPLADLAARQLAAFTELNPDRVKVSGPPVNLKPEAVQPLGMSLHELATNATKYGALVQPAGKLEVNWSLHTCRDGNWLNFRWFETGLDGVRTPEKRGFGHAVLTALSKQSFGSDTVYEFEPGRISWSVDIPGSMFVAAT